MAAKAQAQQTGISPFLTAVYDACWYGLLAAGCVVLLPCLALPAGVWLAGRVRPTRWLLLPPLAAFAAAVLWLRAHPTTAYDAWDAYAAAQRMGGSYLLARVQGAPLADAPWRDYLGGVAPLAGLVGGAAALPLAAFPRSRAGAPQEGGTGRNASERVDGNARFRATSADRLRARRTDQAWCVELVAGPGVLTMVAAPPKVGKTTALAGAMRAQQDGADWFGLAAAPLRWCYATEEDGSFADLAERFGLTDAVVPCVLPRKDVRAPDWPGLVALIEKAARKAKCKGIVVDTMRGWTGRELVTVEDLAPLRALAERGWVVVAVHHGTKAGGSHGAGVAGSYAVVGAVDVLVEVRRVDESEDERSLEVIGRYGCWSRRGRLDGHRYVALGAAGDACSQEERGGETPNPPRASVRPAPQVPSLPLLPPPAPPRERVLDAVRAMCAAEGYATLPQVVLVTDLPKTTAYKLLQALKRDGVLVEQPTRGNTTPSRWTLAAAAAAVE